MTFHGIDEIDRGELRVGDDPDVDGINPRQAGGVEPDGNELAPGHRQLAVAAADVEVNVDRPDAVLVALDRAKEKRAVGRERI